MVDRKLAVASAIGALLAVRLLRRGDLFDGLHNGQPQTAIPDPGVGFEQLNRAVHFKIQKRALGFVSGGFLGVEEN
jgi:hypothetical protein